VQVDESDAVAAEHHFERPHAERDAAIRWIRATQDNFPETP